MIYSALFTTHTFSNGITYQFGGVVMDFQQYKLPALYGNDFIFNFPHYRLGPTDGSSCDILGLDNLPLADFRWRFEESLSPLQVTFSKVCSYEVLDWHWDFGDGATATERFPVHTYDSAGVYQVCLTASNAYGADTLCKTLYLGVTAVQSPVVDAGIQLMPNPFGDALGLLLNVSLPAPQLWLFDAFGRLVHREALALGFNEFDTAGLPEAVYFYCVKAGQKLIKSGKLIRVAGE